VLANLADHPQPLPAAPGEVVFSTEPTGSGPGSPAGGPGLRAGDPGVPLPARSACIIRRR